MLLLLLLLLLALCGLLARAGTVAAAGGMALHGARLGFWEGAVWVVCVCGWSVRVRVDAQGGSARAVISGGGGTVVQEEARHVSKFK